MLGRCNSACLFLFKAVTKINNIKEHIGNNNTFK